LVAISLHRSRVKTFFASHLSSRADSKDVS
jgi:hypothetical protein